MQFDRMMFLLAPLWGAIDLAQFQFPEVFASLKPPANGCNSFGVFDYQFQVAIASIHPDRGFKPIEIRTAFKAP